MNPDYEKLGEIAKQTVIQTMLEGEKKHGTDGWKEQCGLFHLRHIYNHCSKAYDFDTSDDHIAHAMTRCAMIKYLEVEHDTK
jgi:hypothetical protein